MKQNYIFKSERLGFRNWLDSDMDVFVALNADPDVMEHFPATLSRKETADFITRLQRHYDERKHTYFAVDTLADQEFIGFIGLAFQEYASPFTPNVDIGWRLKKAAWGKGYATEGAKRCLKFGFEELELERIIATCTITNTKSENVMRKIGMTRAGEFDHPRLIDYPEMQRCVCYLIKYENSRNTK